MGAPFSSTKSSTIQPASVSLYNVNSDTQPKPTTTMFFAIKTKLIPATDTRGTTIKAAVVGESGQCGRPATISYDYALSTKENHSAALAALRVIYGMPLNSEFVGSTACGRGEMIHLFKR